MLRGKPLEVWHPCHRPVVVHDLAYDGRGLQTGNTRDVHARLGLTCTYKNAAGLCPERKDVSGPCQIGRS